MDAKTIFEKGLEKVAHMESSLQDFPHITKGGEWLTHRNGHWTGGFWTGLMWLRFLVTGNARDRQTAMNWARRFESRKQDNKTHDMGFIFGPSCLLGNRVTGNEELGQLAISGAQNLIDLYRPGIGLALAWDEPGYEGVSIVDTIINVPIIVERAKRLDEPENLALAQKLADRIAECHVRPDHSIYHVVRWDSQTFTILEKTTHQGFSSESYWSRGQAWALYGFANMYRYTKERRYLEQSARLAEFFYEQLDDEITLPRWDFVFRNQNEEPWDAAAASIAASGMLLLADLYAREEAQGKAAQWEERAKSILLAEIEHCLYRHLDRYGIIEQVTVDKPHNSGIGESSMYGDYYFMEALYRLMFKGHHEKLDLLY
jgi:unsaturated chondroitin disaccharide hydrolase